MGDRRRALLRTRPIGGRLAVGAIALLATLATACGDSDSDGGDAESGSGNDGGDASSSAEVSDLPNETMCGLVSPEIVGGAVGLDVTDPTYLSTTEGFGFCSYPRADGAGDVQWAISTNFTIDVMVTNHKLAYGDDVEIVDLPQLGEGAWGGPEALDRWQANGPLAAGVVLTSHADDETASLALYEAVADTLG